MGKLILVRHGETSINAAGNLHSANDPESLNGKGRAQMKKTAKELLKYFPSVIFSSKEKRSIESAQILSKIIKIPVDAIDGLQERNWGIFTGKPWSEVKKVLDPMSLGERYIYVPPNGESWRTFETRLIKAIKKVVNKDKVVAVVTHGGAIRVLMPYLLNVSREESFKYDPDNASLTIFDFDGRKYRNSVVNDTSHLKIE